MLNWYSLLLVLQALHRETEAMVDVSARAPHFARFARVFGSLADAPAFVTALAGAMTELRRGGAAQALARRM